MLFDIHTKIIVFSTIHLPIQCVEFRTCIKSSEIISVKFFSFYLVNLTCTTTLHDLKPIIESYSNF